VVNHGMNPRKNKEINLLVEAHTNPDEARRRAELGDAEAQYALAVSLQVSAEWKGGATIREPRKDSEKGRGIVCSARARKRGQAKARALLAHDQVKQVSG